MASSEEGLFELIRVSAFGEPSVLEVAKEKLESLKPKESEVLVRVLAAGINPVETYIRAGTYARKPALPYTPGTDGAGLVEQLGPDYDGPLKLGDRVWLAGSKTGTYAQYCLCASSDVFPLPSSLSFPQGAALNIPYATAYRALFTRGGGKAGETVLIHGASGGVGVAAVQLAAKAGLRVIGTAGTPEGRALVTRLGAEAVFDHHQAGYLEDIRAFAAPFGGVDLIVEMIANINLANDLTLLSIHGRVLIVGNRGALEINPRAIMAVEADVRGVALAHTSPEERRAAFEAINRGLQAGDLVPVAEDDAILPLSKAPQAHHDIIHTRRFGKLCLDPWSSASAL